MKFKIKSLLVLAIALSTQVFSQGGIVTSNGLLKVNGNKIENASGQVFKVAGNSMYWSGFDGGSQAFYTETNAPLIVNHLADEWGSGLVRAAMAVAEASGTNPYVNVPNFRAGLTPNPSARGYFNNPAVELEKIENIIDAAIAKDIYVIVDFHSHFADQFEPEAITFFEHIATKYGSNPHIIYEIFNEPISTENHRNNNENMIFSSPTLQQQTWNNIIKPYAINVINAIRAIDPDNLIIVGTPGFSQFVNVAADNRITTADLNLPAGADLNVAYTLHFYAGTHTQFLRDIAEQAMDIDGGNNGSNGVALFVTEWGTVDASGNGGIDVNETINWVNFMNNNDISHANWSVVDQNESSAVVQAGLGVQGLLNGNLTPSGNLVKCIVENYNAGTDFTGCMATMGPAGPIPDCGDGGGVVPQGVGIKVEVETPDGTGQTDLCGNRSDFRSSGLAVSNFMGQDILTGFTGGSGTSGGESAVFFLNPVNATDNYTIQVVFSSDGPNNTLNLKRDAGETLLASVSLPDTGGLNNYQIISVPGIGVLAEDKTVEINITGSDNANVESFYYTLDNNPALSVPSFTSEVASQISVYPIPASSVLNIDTPSNIGEVNYTIYDLKGSVIKNRSQLSNGKVTIQDLVSGIYLIQLYINNQTQIYKFVKN